MLFERLKECVPFVASIVVFAGIPSPNTISPTCIFKDAVGSSNVSIFKTPLAVRLAFLTSSGFVTVVTCTELLLTIRSI